MSHVGSSLGLDGTLSHEHGGDEGRSSSGSIRTQHQIELVICAHELGDPRLHNVGEMGVEPENGSVDGNDHVLVVHLLEQGSDSSRDHEAGATGHTFADIPEGKGRATILLK